jgi:antitoxin component YwqK of YwqJK toxin-antitoxin module
MQERINYLYGKRHGIYRAWYLNGAIHIEANYHHGVLHGEYRAWCYTETLLEHSNYSLGELAE